MFHEYKGVRATKNYSMECLVKAVNICRMKAGGWFVHNEYLM